MVVDYPYLSEDLYPPIFLSASLRRPPFPHYLRGPPNFLPSSVTVLPHEARHLLSGFSTLFRSRCNIMSRSGPRPSNLPSSAARTSFLPPSHKLLQLAAARRAGRPVHATDLRTTKFYKTKLCPFMQSKRGGGRCSEGFDCGYAHAVEELRDAPDLQRTKWCSKVVNGLRCTDPKCGYAHCAQELQPSKDRQTLKTSLCLFWTRDPKFCLNGDKCRFAHGVHDLRKRLALPPRCPSPLINSLATSQEPSYSFFVPAHEGVIEKAAVQGTHISSALTTLPTAEAGFDASSDRAALLSWETAPYAGFPNRASTALQPPFLTDINSSALQNKGGFRQLLLQGSALGGKTSAGTSQPNISPGVLPSWRTRCSQYEGDITAPTNHLLTWLPSDTLDDVSASENATTQIVDESSFSAATTAGPEGGEINYPAFPLLPSQISRCGESEGGNDRHHYALVGASPCTLEPNLVEPRGTLQLPGRCGISLKDHSQQRDKPGEKLLCRFTFSSPSQPQRHYPPVTFPPLSTQTKTYIEETQMSDAIKNSQQQIRVVSSLPYRPETEKPDACSDRKSSCFHLLQEGEACMHNALSEPSLPTNLPQRADADEHSAVCLPKLAPYSSGVHFRRTGESCSFPHRDLLCSAVSPNGDAGGKAQRNPHVWTGSTTVDSAVVGTSCLRSGEERTPHRPQPKAKRLHARPMYSATGSAKPCQHKHNFPYAESLKQSPLSTVVCRARRVGSNWEHLCSATDLVETPVAKKRSISFSDQCWRLHSNEVTTSIEAFIGPPAMTAELNKSRGTLNAHAPPFFPRTLLRYTYRQQDSGTNTGIQGTCSEPVKLPSQSDRNCRTSQTSFVSADKELEEDTCEDVRAPVWQVRRRVCPVDWQQQRGQQPHNTTNVQESECSNSCSTADGANHSKRFNAYTAAQPTVFMLSEIRKIASRESQNETLARLCEAEPSDRREAQAGNPFGTEENSIFLTLARFATARRLPTNRPASVGICEPSAFHDATPSSEHAAVTYSDDTYKHGLVPHSISADGLVRIPDNLYSGPPSDCGDDVYIGTPMPNNLNLPPQYKQGQNFYVNYPYAVLQEALWLKARATADHDGTRYARVVIRGDAADLSAEEVQR